MDELRVGAEVDDVAILLDALCVVRLGNFFGTGLLIRPRLVLTNYHVVKEAIRGRESWPNGECLFDTHVPPGWSVKISSCIGWSELSPGDESGDEKQIDITKCDYALLWLEESDRLDRSNLTYRRYRFHPLPLDLPEAQDNDEIVVAQHPSSQNPHGVTGFQKAQLSRGTLMLIARKARIRHTASTLPGSSGGPCFNKRFEFIGLHQAGDIRSNIGGDLHQAIPAIVIRNDVVNQGLNDHYKVFGLADPASEPEISAPAADIAGARYEAAKTLMNRHDQEGALFSAWFGETGPGRADAPLVHAFACKGDAAEPHWLANRLAQLTLVLKARDEYDRAHIDMLRDATTARLPWHCAKSGWPSPWDLTRAERLDRLRDDIKNSAGDLPGLRMYSREIDETVDLAEERALIEAFAQAAANDFKLRADQFQAIVVFIARDEGPEMEKLLAAFAALWGREDRPPYCGVSGRLADVRRDDLQGWKDYLHRAWNIDESRLDEAIASGFGAARLRPLRLLAEGLEDTVRKCIESSLGLSKGRRT
jgi:hypothetical protein